MNITPQKNPTLKVSLFKTPQAVPKVRREGAMGRIIHHRDLLGSHFSIHLVPEEEKAARDGLVVGFDGVLLTFFVVVLDVFKLFFFN